jgi:hypothetical protein
MLPTTKVTLLAEQQGENAFGDPTDEYHAIAKNVPAHIYERDSNRQGVELATRLELKGIIWAGVEEGTRLIDQEDGRYYSVVKVVRRKNPVMQASEVFLQRSR